MMPSVCLINFNARIYDPSLGRFMSADPVMQSPYDLQLLNRYSYVGNNPLSLTDPSGLCFMGCFWTSSIFRGIVAIIVAIVLPEALGEVEGTAFEGVLDDASVTTLNVGIAGGVAGYIATGTANGAFFGAVQANAFLAAGNAIESNPTYFFGSATATTFIAHGMVGGLFSAGSKGGFVSGFLAGGVSSLADNPALDTGDKYLNTAEHAVLGGGSSVLGGGKFLNGAVTGAFGYLYNYCQHHPCNALAKETDAIAMAPDYYISDYEMEQLHAEAQRTVTNMNDAFENIIGLPLPEEWMAVRVYEWLDRLQKVWGIGVAVQRDAHEADEIDNEYARLLKERMRYIDVDLLVKQGVLVREGPMVFENPYLWHDE